MIHNEGPSCIQTSGFQAFGLHSLCKQMLISHSVFLSHPVWLPYSFGGARNTCHMLKGLFLGLPSSWQLWVCACFSIMWDPRRCAKWAFHHTA